MDRYPNTPFAYVAQSYLSQDNPGFNNSQADFFDNNDLPHISSPIININRMNTNNNSNNNNNDDNAEIKQINPSSNNSSSVIVSPSSSLDYDALDTGFNSNILNNNGYNYTNSDSFSQSNTVTNNVVPSFSEFKIPEFNSSGSNVQLPQFSTCPTNQYGDIFSDTQSQYSNSNSNSNSVNNNFNTDIKDNLNADNSFAQSYLGPNALNNKLFSSSNTDDIVFNSNQNNLNFISKYPNNVNVPNQLSKINNRNSLYDSEIKNDNNFNILSDEDGSDSADERIFMQQRKLQQLQLQYQEQLIKERLEFQRQYELISNSKNEPHIQPAHSYCYPSTKPQAVNFIQLASTGNLIKSKKPINNNFLPQNVLELRNSNNNLNYSQNSYGTEVSINNYSNMNLDYSNSNILNNTSTQLNINPDLSFNIGQVTPEYLPYELQELNYNNYNDDYNSIDFMQSKMAKTTKSQNVEMNNNRYNDSNNQHSIFSPSESIDSNFAKFNSPFNTAGSNISITSQESNKSKSGRVVQACDSCRARKNKCDGNQPLCAACKKGDIPCTWTPKGILKKRKNTDNKAKLFDEHGILTIPLVASGTKDKCSINFNFLTKRLRELGVKADMIESLDTDIYDRLINVFLEEQEHYDKSKLISINEPFVSVDSIESDINNIDGLVDMKAHMYEIDKIKNNVYKVVGGTKVYNDNLDTLNDEITLSAEEKLELVEIFFNKGGFTQVVPFLRKDIFIRDFKDNKIPQLLLNAIFSHSAKFWKGSSEHKLAIGRKYYWGDIFYNKCKRLIGEGEGRGIVGIQSLVLLSSYAYFSGRTADCISFSLLASAGSLAFGLNQEPSKKSSFYEREVLIRTFWAVFVIDRHISWLLDSPRTVIARSDVLVKVPAPQSCWEIASESNSDEPKVSNAETMLDPLLALLPVYDIFDRIWHEQKAMVSGLETNYGMMSSFLVSSIERRNHLESFDESRWPRFMRGYRRHLNSLNLWKSALKYKNIDEALENFAKSNQGSYNPNKIFLEKANEWLWLYAYIIYHTSQVLLFKSPFLRSASHILRSKNKNWKLSHGTKEAVEAACNVMNILEKYILNHDEGFATMHGSFPMIICLSVSVFADILILPSLTEISLDKIESYLKSGIIILSKSLEYFWVAEVCLHGLRMRLMSAQDKERANRILKLIPLPSPRRII